MIEIFLKKLNSSLLENAAISFIDFQKSALPKEYSEFLY